LIAYKNIARTIGRNPLKIVGSKRIQIESAGNVYKIVFIPVVPAKAGGCRNPQAVIVIGKKEINCIP
jgi:hypothetical protein